MTDPLVSEERIAALVTLAVSDPDPRIERLRMHAENAIRQAIREAGEEAAKVAEQFNSENFQGAWCEDDWTDLAAAAIRRRLP